MSDLYDTTLDQESLEEIDIDDEFFNDEDIDKDVLEELQNDTDTVVKEDTTTKNKKSSKKSKKIVDPFVYFCKTYLSSLMARSSKYGILYLDNDHTDSLILLNSRNKMTFEDYLLQYVPGDLSIHIVQFKDDSLAVFKEKIHATTPITMLLNIQAIRTAVNTAQKNKSATTLPIKFAVDKDHTLYIQYTDVTKKDADGHPLVIIDRYGVAYNDWRTLCILCNLVKKMEHMESFNTAVIHDVKYEDLVPCMTQNILYYSIHIKEYIDKGYPSVVEYPENYKTPIVLMDGKDIISTKEYLKKQKDPYSLKIVSVFNPPNLNIDYCSIYDDTHIHVISSRPFTSTYPHLVSIKEN